MFSRIISKNLVDSPKIVPNYFFSDTDSPQPKPEEPESPLSQSHIPIPTPRIIFHRRSNGIRFANKSRRSPKRQAKAEGLQNHIRYFEYWLRSAYRFPTNGEREDTRPLDFHEAAIHLTRCIFACTHAFCPRRVASTHVETRRGERARERDTCVSVRVCTHVYLSLVNIHTSHEARRRTLAASYKVSVNKS